MKIFVTGVNGQLLGERNQETKKEYIYIYIYIEGIGNIFHMLYALSDIGRNVFR